MNEGSLKITPSSPHPYRVSLTVLSLMEVMRSRKPPYVAKFSLTLFTYLQIRLFAYLISTNAMLAIISSERLSAKDIRVLYVVICSP